MTAPDRQAARGGGNVTDPRLKPCPWCGKTPEPMTITSGEDGRVLMRGIFCLTPDCPVHPYFDAASVGFDSGNAIFRWNRRSGGGEGAAR